MQTPELIRAKLYGTAGPLLALGYFRHGSAIVLAFDS